MNSAVISQSSVEEQSLYARGREVFIRLSLLAIMSVSCILLLRPFLNLIICGIIIAVGLYPIYRKLTKALAGHSKLSATLCSVALLIVVIVPSLLLADTLVDGLKSMTQQVKAGQLHVPPPPPSLETMPLIGPRLNAFWTQCSTNLAEVTKRFGPQILKSIPAVLVATAGIGGTILQFIVAIVIAGFLLGTSEACSRFADKLFVRIFGERGPDFKDLVSSTIRTVTTGILGVAFIQTLFASLGFYVAGLPGAGLWAVVFLIASILQAGVIVLLPAAIFGFAEFSTTRAVIFLVWCIIVGLMDNVLKPILLGRGAKVPMLVIFLGVLGGFIVMNSIIGLFVGAIVLSVGYKLFMAWLDADVQQAFAPEETRSLSELPGVSGSVTR